MAVWEQRYIIEVSLPEPASPQCHSWLWTGTPSGPSVNRGLSLGVIAPFFCIPKSCFTNPSYVFFPPLAVPSPRPPRMLSIPKGICVFIFWAICASPTHNPPTHTHPTAITSQREGLRLPVAGRWLGGEEGGAPWNTSPHPYHQNGRVSPAPTLPLPGVFRMEGVSVLCGGDTLQAPPENPRGR